MGRFINADAFASTGQGILGNNMFAYCGNNPTGSTDPDGESHIEWEKTPEGVKAETKERYRNIVGTVTVVASVEYKILEGFVADLSAFEICITTTNIEVLFPDGQIYTFNYGDTHIDPSEYSLNLFSIGTEVKIGTKLVASADGFGFNFNSTVGCAKYSIQVQYKQSIITRAIEALAKIVPPGIGGGGGGAPFGCGSYSLRNPTLMFM